MKRCQIYALNIVRYKHIAAISIDRQETDLLRSFHMRSLQKKFEIICNYFQMY